MDFVQHVDALKADKHEFILHTRGWDSIAIQAPLKWRSVKFSKKSRCRIPRKPGIYAFLIRARNSQLPPFSYLIYIGIAGYKEDSKRSLLDRFDNYLKEEATLIRPKIHYMLKKYSGHIDFCFCTVNRDMYDLQIIEKELNDKLIPPCNINDFSGEMRQASQVIWQ